MQNYDECPDHGRVVQNVQDHANINRYCIDVYLSDIDDDETKMILSYDKSCRTDC